MAADALPPRVVAVAYSGGRDSTALLHATLASAAAHGAVVWALHVHHGLSAQADAWEQHCAVQCDAWALAGLPVRFASERLVTVPVHPQGTEAWAREGRYAALTTMAHAAGAELVLLAHHRRDQAETVVLQALRGGGVDGWSAMPALAHRDGLTWARPWLDRPRAAIDAYVAEHGLVCIDDPSNSDPRHDRNRLRLHAWPALTAAFPNAESALAGAARRAQDASACLAELARLDLGPAADGGPLDMATWAALSTARRGNALRAWLRKATGCPAPATVVARLLAEATAADAGREGRGGRWWSLPGDWQVRCWRGRLIVVPAPAATPDLPTRAPGAEAAPLAIHGEGRWRIGGWPGWLRVSEADEGGVALDWLPRLLPRPRRGGERFQPAPGRPARSLKLQFQAAGVPSWLRHGPLLYGDDRLVFVAGLGIDAHAMARPGARQVVLAWEADDRPAQPLQR